MVKLYGFSFGKVHFIRQNLAEIIVDEGVDINVVMVDELHQLLLSILTAPFSLLINKKNSYSSQLDALEKFGNLPQINKIAVFAPNKMAQLSADFAVNIPSSSSLNIRVFLSRDDALAWLS